MKTNPHEKYHIAVFGSASEKLPRKIYDIAYDVGQTLAHRGHTLISPVSTGIGFYAAKGAKSAGGTTIGVSPTANTKEQKMYDVPFEYIDHLIHTGFGFKGRNVISVRTCDGLVVVNGGFGTLSEVAIAVGEDKPIVVVSDTGGCADILSIIFKKLNPKYALFKIVGSPSEAITTLEQLINQTRQL